MGITGPFKINGVPLRRLNQRYAIATSTKIELPGSIAGLDEVTDADFKKPKKKKQQKEDELFVEEEKASGGLPDSAKALQAKVDASVVKAVASADPLMKAYLQRPFSLDAGVPPH